MAGHILKNYRLIDLTHKIDSSIPHWDRGCAFKLLQAQDYLDCQGLVKFRAQDFHLRAGLGTHLDAPAHCIPGGRDIASLNLEDLIAPCYVINVTHKIQNPDYFISLADIKEFETKYNPNFKNSLLIAYTGWSQYWYQIDKYRNEDEKGNMHFPGFAVESIRYLLAKGIKGIAIDTLSPDGSHEDFPVHQLMLENGKYIIENVINVELLPEVGALIITLPLNIVNATESPVRMIALIDNSL
ncbi:MAG: hypothetical protein A3E87_09355 [Gammaproteobacteria bacterium RIFCSPHIGHO2_12_FULL_35_23]|nr:MAG: hypothetical protein A3E87_09355 [Gammaproteobacteria bacterium RIFCSPHIGHO2_12_FULL_35_23]